jgi:hypothetical protein
MVSQCVWAGILSNQVVDPFLLHERLCAWTCCVFLQGILPFVLGDSPLHICHQMWYHHDRAPAHSGMAVLHYLNATWTCWWLVCSWLISWPASFPDLNSLAFLSVQSSKVSVLWWGSTRGHFWVYRKPPFSITTVNAEILQCLCGCDLMWRCVYCCQWEHLWTAAVVWSDGHIMSLLAQNFVYFMIGYYCIIDIGSIAVF